MDDSIRQKVIGIIENSKDNELLAVAKLRALQIPLDEEKIKHLLLSGNEKDIEAYLSTVVKNIRVGSIQEIKDTSANIPSEASLKKALEDIKLRHNNKITRLTTKYEERLRPFREQLVARWIQHSKKRVNSDLIVEECVKALTQTNNKERATVKSTLIKRSDSESLTHAISGLETEAGTLASETSEIFKGAWNSPAPDLLVTAYERRDELFKTSPEEFARRVVSYNTSPPDGVDFTKTFFRSLALSTDTGSLQRNMASLYDTAFSLLVRNPEKRKQIIESAIRSGFSGAEERLQKTTGDVLTSDVIKKIITSETGKIRQTGVFNQARGVLDDFFGSLIGRRTDLVDNYLKTLSSIDKNRAHFGGHTLNSAIPSEQRDIVEILLFASYYQAFPQQISIAHNQEGGGWAAHMAKDIARHELFNAVFGFIRSKLFTQAATGTAAAIGAPLTGGATIPAFLISLFGEKIAGNLVSYFSSFVGAFTGRKNQNYDFIILTTLIGVMVFIMIFGFSGVITRAPMFIGMQKGGEDVSGEAGSQYIRLSKKANPDSIPDNNPRPITYTITIQAISKKLTNIKISDEFSVYGGTGSISPPLVASPESISPGEERVISFTVPLSSLFKNSVITNMLTVTADAEEKTGETKTAYASVVIGEPNTGCFQFKDIGGSSNSCDSSTPTSAWNSQEKGIMIFAASQIAKYPLYMSKLKCSSSPIPLYRVKKEYGGGCFQDGGIYIYNGGAIHGSSVYTLAHETGHVLQYRNGSYYQLFLSKGISSPLREGYLQTYPGKKKDTEDFAETIGLFIGHSHYYPPKWSSYPKYPSAFPIHEKFAQCLMVNDKICNSL